MHHIDILAAQELAETLGKNGFTASASYGDIGEVRAFAQGPFVRIEVAEGQPVFNNRESIQKLLSDFYRDSGFIDLDRQIIARRLGRFGELLLVTQFTEFFDIATEIQISHQLQAINDEFSRFNQYLDTRAKRG